MVLGAEYLLKMVPKGTHDPRKFIRPAELMARLDSAPLTVRHLCGMHYNPLRDRFTTGRGSTSIICCTPAARRSSAPSSPPHFYPRR